MWFDPLTNWLVALLSNAPRVAKEKFTKEIPAENWANKELYHQDTMNGTSIQQRLKWAEEGRYKLPPNMYPEPHRDPVSGKIIIENNALYNEDVLKYGAYQAQQWVKQGKYNLAPEELEKEKERIKAKYDYLYKL